MQQGANELTSPREGEAPPEPLRQAEATPDLRRRRPRLIARIVRATTWTYLGFILAGWLLIALAADRWWLGTTAMFGPSWVWALGLIPLVPLAALLHRRSLFWLGLATLVVLFPITRFCVPWRTALPTGGTDQFPLKLRVLTLNTDLRELHPKDLGKVIADLRPDLVVLQDWRSRYQAKVFAEGWHLRREGELVLASRYPITGSRICVGPEFPEFTGRPGTLAVFEVSTPQTAVNLLNVHLETPRDGLSALMHRAWGPAKMNLRKNSQTRREQSRVVRRVAGSLPGPVIVAGDFNTPTTSAAYRDHWSGWQNAFSVAGWGWGHTHFTPKTGVRIDHVLVPDRGWRVDRCWVGPDVGSAHRPVIADLVWLGLPK
jgi:vancomycin resistance protein VanJ